MTTESASATPTLAEVVRRALEAMMLGKFKARPGRIESYDAARQVATAKPMLKRRIAAAGGQEIVEAMQVVSEVPVLFSRSRDFFLSFPLAAGDYVLLVGVDQSIDAFVSSQVGADVDPDDFRFWDETDVVALPGFWPFAAALPDASALDMVLGKTGGPRIQISATEIKLGASATEALVKGNTYRSAEDSVLTAIGVFATAVGVAVPAVAGAAATLNAAIASFQAAAATYLSTTSKTE